MMHPEEEPTQRQALRLRSRAAAQTARYAVFATFMMLFGVFGIGAALIVEGVSSSENTRVALGVLCVVVALLASTATTWKVSALGFEIRAGGAASSLVAPAGSTPERAEPPDTLPPDVVQALIEEATQRRQRDTVSPPDD